MLRDNLAGLIEPMRAARELNPLALFTEQKKSSDDRPQDALKIPAPKGRNLTLTENAASPFHAEPRQSRFLPGACSRSVHGSKQTRAIRPREHPPGQRSFGAFQTGGIVCLVARAEVQFSAYRRPSARRPCRTRTRKSVA